MNNKVLKFPVEKVRKRPISEPEGMLFRLSDAYLTHPELLRELFLMEGGSPVLNELLSTEEGKNALRAFVEQDRDLFQCLAFHRKRVLRLLGFKASERKPRLVRGTKDMNSDEGRAYADFAKDAADALDEALKRK